MVSTARNGGISYLFSIALCKDRISCFAMDSSNDAARGLSDVAAASRFCPTDGFGARYVKSCITISALVDFRDAASGPSAAVARDSIARMQQSLSVVQNGRAVVSH